MKFTFSVDFYVFSCFALMSHKGKLFGSLATSSKLVTFPCIVVGTFPVLFKGFSLLFWMNFWKVKWTFSQLCSEILNYIKSYLLLLTGE